MTPAEYDEKFPELGNWLAGKPPLKVTGEPRQFESGAQRDAVAGKARFDLLPVTALERVAKHYEKGAVKYGENNWRKGIPRAEFVKSAFRHLMYWLRGDNDEDHAAALVWNVLGWMETVELDLDKPASKI